MQTASFQKRRQGLQRFVVRAEDRPIVVGLAADSGQSIFQALCKIPVESYERLSLEFTQDAASQHSCGA